MPVLSADSQNQRCSDQARDFCLTPDGRFCPSPRRPFPATASRPQQPAVGRASLFTSFSVWEVARTLRAPDEGFYRRARRTTPRGENRSPGFALREATLSRKGRECTEFSAREHQNIRLSFTSTQRPPLTCCTWVMVLARWSVLENLVGGELKMSRNFSPDSSESNIFWPVRSLPALFA